jgi:hypothetical protein
LLLWKVTSFKSARCYLIRAVLSFDGHFFPKEPLTKDFDFVDLVKLFTFTSRR